MRAAIYIAYAPGGEAFTAEEAAARAFCAREGLLPVALFHSDVIHAPEKVEGFLQAVRSGSFGVIVAPYPDCFSTRVLKQLVGAGVGLACYPLTSRSRGRKRP